METLNELWGQIEPYLPMIIQIIIMPVLIPIIRRLVGNKVDSAMNEKRIRAMQEKAYNDTLGKVKDVSFKHSIQPLVENALMEIQEKALARLDEKFTQRQEIDKQNAVFTKHFMELFDNSIMSNPAKKAELQEDYKKLLAIIAPESVDTVDSESIVLESNPSEKPKRKTIDMEI